MRTALIHASFNLRFNAGIVLDGIAGMFTAAEPGSEQLALNERQAICAIAMQAGADIVPGYCFGTNQVAKVVQDPFGLLRWLSITLDVSLTPFIGRWYLPMGPPRPEPLVFAYGNPVNAKDALASTQPSPREVVKDRAVVAALHKRLLSSFEEIFENHKAAYGWTGHMGFV